MSRFKTILALGLAAGLAEASALGQAPERVFPRVSISGGGASITVGPSGASLIVEPPTPTRPPAPARRAMPAPVHSIDALPAPLLIPDVYPSRADAARGVAELWAAKVSDQSSPPTNVRVYCCDSALYAALRDGIVSRLPRGRVEKARGEECPDGYHDGRPADGEARLLVDAKETQIVLPEAPRGRRGRTPEPGGTLTLTARGAADVAVTASFVEKPWLADFALFTHSLPGRWVVGRSDPLRPAMSPAEAADAARRAAAKELFPVVRARVQRAGRSNLPDDWIRRQLDAKLAGGRLVVDRFPQRFQRPGYDTWREAVLVDASDRELDRLVGDIHAERFQERQSWVRTVASVGGLLLVIYTLYRLANAFTRGYFVWSLRTAAAVAATAVVVIISMIA